MATSTTESPFQSAREILRISTRDAIRCLPDLVMFELLCVAIVAVTVSPFTAWLGQRLVATRGDAAVGNFDIVYVLLTPVGMTIGLLISTLMFTIFLLKLSGQMVIGHAANEGRRCSYFEALRHVARNFKDVLLGSLMLIVLAAAVALPFLLAALLTHWFLLTAHDINYYLDTRPPEYLAAIAIGVLLLVVLLAATVTLATPLLFVLPEIMFHDRKPLDAIKQSRHLAKGSFTRLAVVVVTWLVAWALLTLLVNAALFLFGYLAVAAASQGTTRTLIALGILSAAATLCNAFVTFLASSVACTNIAETHQQLSRGDRSTFDVNDLPKLADGMPWMSLKKTPLILATLVIAVAIINSMRLLDGLGMRDTVDNTAHRGSSIAAPENSLVAVLRAIPDGATHVEIDVQRTADGVIVVAHDEDLMRVGGSPHVISETNYEDMKDVVVSGRLRDEYPDERLPTLDQVLGIVKGKVKLIIELKSYKTDPGPLAREVVRLVKQRNMVDEASVMSLKFKELQIVEQIDPNITTGYAVSTAMGDLSQLDIDFLAVSKSYATDAFVATAHGSGKPVYVWTVDEPEEMRDFIDMGVDNIITNKPATLADVIKERGELTNSQQLLLRFRRLFQ